MTSGRNNRQKKQVQRIKRKNRIQQRQLSPEAIRPEEFSNYLSSLGDDASRYIQKLRDTNGSTEPKDDDPHILWAVRDESTGRCIGETRPGGSEHLYVSLTRSLAIDAAAVELGIGNASTAEKEAAVAQSNLAVVWMDLADFREKVCDAVKTGYPTSLILRCACYGTYAIEHERPCQKTVTTAGFAEFRNVLARAWDFSPKPTADSASPRTKQPVIHFLG
ncbi:MAG: hypothetical protein ACYC3X_30880 [Pirellulaceae bacterium]